MHCGRFLVNMIKKRDEENIAPPITSTQHATVEDDLKIISSSDEVSSNETHAVLTPVKHLYLAVAHLNNKIMLPRTTIFHGSGAMKVILKTLMKILIFNCETKMSSHLRSYLHYYRRLRPAPAAATRVRRIPKMIVSK